MSSSLANLAGIARPYARAAFEVAANARQLEEWHKFFENLLNVVRHEDIAALIANQAITAAQIFDILDYILGVHINQQQKNFLRLVSENKRIYALVAIADKFFIYCAKTANVRQVRMVSAVSTGEKLQLNLQRVLSKQLNYAVNLQCEVDSTLIGGAMIYIDDKVIDGSVRGKLARLLENLTS